MPQQCIICGTQADLVSDGFFQSWECPRCGEYDFDATVAWKRPTTPMERALLSGWVRDQNQSGIVPVRITPNNARAVMARRFPGLEERAMRALSVFARKYPDLQVPVENHTLMSDPELLASCYSFVPDELTPLLLILEDYGYIKVPGSRIGRLLTVRGLLAAEKMGASGSSSLRGFVAMSFDNALRDVWTNGFEPGIRGAGYVPVRIDAEEYVGGISDQIMAEIRRSRFVVADYTQQRNGVYFEAGFALGLGLTVIPTCRADEINKLHFDIKHLNTLAWTTPAELADQLTKRIRAVIGSGDPGK